MLYQEWEYNGYACFMYTENDGDVVKVFHDILKPDGTSILADIVPYGTMDQTLVEKYIDLGCPSRHDLKKSSPLTYQEISGMWHDRFGNEFADDLVKG